MHAPLHTAGAETRLVGVWSGRKENAERLAAVHGVQAFPSYEELLQACEAVDFAVPPDVQADLAPEAAAGGKALMLEKPLGASLNQARKVHDAILASNTPNIVVLTKRFHPRTRAFLSSLRELQTKAPISAVRGLYLHGGFLDTGFLDPSARGGWRRRYGALYDLGPHILDLIDLAAGPIHTVHATGDPAKYLALTTEHVNGAVGQTAVSGSVQLERVETTVDVFSPAGSLAYSTAGMNHDECWPILRAEFAAAVRTGAPVSVDAARALHLQTILEATALSIHDKRPVTLNEVTGPDTRNSNTLAARR
jgi:predicted dehydrogenase